MWNKAKIYALLDQNDKAVIAALKALYAHQTADEQAGHTTNKTNGVGFSQFDAPFLTDMVLAVRRWGGLTPKQMAVTRNKVRRYHRQLVDIANANEAKNLVLEEPTIERIELDEGAAEAADIARAEAGYHAAENARDMQQEYDRMARKHAYEMGAFA